MALDLEQFVKFLIKDEVMNAALPFSESNYPAWEWPFDREVVLSKNPSILNFKGVPLPWDT